MLPFRTAFPALLALAFCVACGDARADVLPWLSQAAHPIADPWGTGKKADRMIAPALKPEACPPAPEGKQKLRFNDVVIAALCHNPDTRIAYLGLLSQAASYGGLYAAYLPNVSANAERGRATSYAQRIIGTTITKSYGISANWTLYDFGQREATIREGELALIAAGHSYNATLQGLIATAMQAYFRLLTAQNAIDIAHATEAYAKASYDAAELRHKIGQVPLADALQAKSAWSQARLASAQAENQVYLERANVAQLVGLPPDTQIEAAEMDDSNLMHDPFGGAVAALMAQARGQRSDVKASRAQMESSEASLEALRRSNLATVSAGVNASTGNSAVNVFSANGNRNQSIGVNVSIPLFTGFSQTYNERAAEKNLESQKEQLARTELAVEQDVWNSWHNYQTAKRSWEVSWDQVATATELKDVALGRYKEGLGTILDVLNAQSQYSSALQSQLQTRYNLLTTRIDLVRAVGVLDLDTVQPDAATQPAPPSPQE